jgi:opacity protein-like surface antigen
MKNIIFVAGLALALMGNAYAADDKEGPGKGEMKEVCTEKKDKAGKVINGKDGKPVQECKKIKVRKKVEGDKVPEKK